MLNKNHIIIPIIQRDYAQGRDGEQTIRKKFLTSLYDAVVKDKRVVLDYVYGSVKKDEKNAKTIFSPIDGQQRLTTLFLLHRYFSWKENVDGKKTDKLMRFCYQVRDTANEFCDVLSKNRLDLGKIDRSEKSLSKAISEANWFHASYNFDLTVKAMLVMLDAIHEKFADVENGWDLNTHSLGAFYEIFEPSRARSLARRLEIIPTPKHGSWLNIAENELSALTARCVKGRRFATIEELRDEVMAWAMDCNAKQKGVDWQFTTEDARIKLVSLYPKFLM